MASSESPALTRVVERRHDDSIDDGSVRSGDVHLWLWRGDIRRIARRAIVTTILARYVGIEPRALAFGRGPDGKPELLTRAPEGALMFSVSSAMGVTALAVAARHVGVDIEPLTRDVFVDGMLDAVCTPGERGQLREPIPEAARREGFIWSWTGKEACAKASGLGLGAPFQQIDVGIGRGDARLVAAPAGSEHGPWMVHRVDAVAGYAVSVAVL